MTNRRLRVGLVAYACHPCEGSEPGAGWQWLSAIAKLHDVDVFTRAGEGKELEDAVRAAGLKVEVVRVATPLDSVDRDGVWRYPKYAYWLMKARTVLRNRNRSHRYDLLHHVTYASDWLPSCIGGLGVPTVWGPVGGSTRTPKELRRYLSRRANLAEGLRIVVSKVSRSTVARRTIRNSSLCVALNSDTARELGRLGAERIVVEPNAIVEISDTPVAARSNDMMTAVYVGRLVEWKGLRIAILALAHDREFKWQLHVYGDGKARAAFEALAYDLGVQDRITFFGRRPRSEVLNALSIADAFVFPSLHDSAPWAVAEAAASGLPVVCFDLGGGPSLAKSNACFIDIDDPVHSIVANLISIAEGERTAQAIDAWDLDKFECRIKRMYEALP
ncbi:glycosyltransferase family 4 protein [Rhodococcus sp. USK10]|uniref:glycosyltransferase family 4 protein n=1 Tax=Rhodococcus sp. USK10 TaxID=2789739 RepID=UPI001C5DB598|nr:glycosyltransferase family 4 protein [Rhodococcus sp. USK10]QYB02803.1 glycosyltransferase family 4 protein [Rhodococcus sp. USK10]